MFKFNYNRREKKQYQKMLDNFIAAGFSQTGDRVDDNGSNKHKVKIFKSAQHPHITLQVRTNSGQPIVISHVKTCIALVWDNEVKGVKF